MVKAFAKTSPKNSGATFCLRISTDVAFDLNANRKHFAASCFVWVVKFVWVGLKIVWVKNLFGLKLFGLKIVWVKDCLGCQICLG